MGTEPPRRWRGTPREGNLDVAPPLFPSIGGVARSDGVVFPVVRRLSDGLAPFHPIITQLLLHRVNPPVFRLDEMIMYMIALFLYKYNFFAVRYDQAAISLKLLCAFTVEKLARRHVAGDAVLCANQRGAF